MLRVLDITGPDILQGNGIRCTLWVSGCRHHCPLCHNRWTWEYNQGMIYKENKEDIYEKISSYLSKEYYEGITLSGGDPLCQDSSGLEELNELLEFVKKEFPDKNVWLYTGYTLSELKSKYDDNIHKILDKCDVIVDGRFENDKKDISLAFRGSSNQTIYEKVNGEFQVSKYNDIK